MEEAKKLKEMQQKASGKGPLRKFDIKSVYIQCFLMIYYLVGGGIKKSGKK